VIAAKTLGPLEVKDEARGFVQAVFSTFEVLDSDGDVTRPGAFRDGAPVIISAYGHSSWGGALPVGKGRIRATSKEAILDGRFFLETAPGRDTFAVVRGMGELQEWSYGYRVVKASFGEFEGRRVRFLEQLEVTEVSPVLQAAGVGTRTLTAKGTSPSFGPQELAVLKAIRGKVLIAQEYQRFQDWKQREELRAQQIRFFKQASTKFTEVSPARVPERTRSAAEASCRAAAADHGIGLPLLKWFKKATLGPIAFSEYVEPNMWLRGLADSKGHTVWLNHALSAHEAVEVAGHEVAHLDGYDEEQAVLRGIRQRTREELMT
jgi:hypothetical protein